jgi:hypothetical protein
MPKELKKCEVVLNIFYPRDVEYLINQRNAWRDAAIEAAREVARLRLHLNLAQAGSDMWRGAYTWATTK